MLCPSWTRRSNSASSCFLSQKSEPPATLAVNGLLAAVLLFMVDSSIALHALHDACYMIHVTRNVLHHKSNNNRNSCKLLEGLTLKARSVVPVEFRHSHISPSFPRRRESSPCFSSVIPRVFLFNTPEHFIPMRGAF